MDALSFWMTARSSAMVFAARTFRMNCLTEMWPSSVSDFRSMLAALRCEQGVGVVLSRVELTGGHDGKVQPHEGTLGPSKGCSGSRVAPALEWAWVCGVAVVVRE